MMSLVPAQPGQEMLIAHLRRQCWDATYRGIYPDDMIDHFDPAWHAQRDLARIQDDHFAVYLICAEEPIGYLILHFAQSAWLHSLYLLPAWQHKGLGAEAFRFARQQFAQRGYAAFTCQCQPENDSALAFYRRMGGVIIDRDEGNEEAYMNSVTLRFLI